MKKLLIYVLVLTPLLSAHATEMHKNKSNQDRKPSSTCGMTVVPEGPRKPGEFVFRIYGPAGLNCPAEVLFNSLPNNPSVDAGKGPNAVKTHGGVQNPTTCEFRPKYNDYDCVFNIKADGSLGYYMD